ncbi:MAG: MotA/TolQ/ExbB proton channel family protein [Candidatus Omnitrophota bacterium]|nr:MotA/TolQ/ExbB proton channel family protein [Candidatus Omnitrophota bacterium]
MWLWQGIVQGGPVMIPIILCSFFACAITIERMLFYYVGLKFNSKEILTQILENVRKNKITEAIEICEKNQYYITNILKAGLIHYEDSKEIIKEEMENTSLYELPKLEKNLNFLSTISHVSPLLGLLGTVTGLVKCFYTIEKKAASVGMVNPSDLAGGIWEALITTVAGLCVAIPGYIAYHYFVHKVDLYILEAERAASELLEVLSQRRYVGEV